MANIKKKAAPKKAAAKKAAPKPVAKPVEDESPLDWPDEGESNPAPAAAAVTIEQVQDLIARAVGDAVSQAVAAVTGAQKRPDAAVEGDEHGDQVFNDIDLDAPDLEMLALTDPVGAQLARNGNSPGGKVVSAAMDILNTAPLTAEQIAGMSDEQIAEYNAAEMRKLQARKQAQVVNRSALSKMSPGDRIRSLTAGRDPNRIRSCDNPLDERMIDCVAMRRVGLGEEGTADVDEHIKVPLSGARHLVDSGAVKVRL